MNCTPDSDPCSCVSPGPADSELTESAGNHEASILSSTLEQLPAGLVMPRSKALVETAHLFHCIAPGGAISRQITGSSHVGTSWLINVQALKTHTPQARHLHSSPRHALDILKRQPSRRQQPSPRVAITQQTATSSFKPPPARQYATSRSRPGPLGTAFLLFPAAAIGVGVLTGYISLNPFSTATKGSSSSAAGMSSKLIPANPADVMVIRNITPNVVTFSVPFKRFGTIPVGGRGTVGK